MTLNPRIDNVTSDIDTHRYTTVINIVKLLLVPKIYKIFIIIMLTVK